MKRSDLLFAVAIAGLFLPFILSEKIYLIYADFNASHGFSTSFLKFAVLATAGEMLGLRIRTGSYNHRGFGILPRACVWGLLGLSIMAAFMIFGQGVPAVLVYFGVEDARSVMEGPLTFTRVLVAFSISFFMNLIFAPVMMTLHKVTDTHIINNGGTMAGLFRRTDVAGILGSINWKVHFGFVLRRTIPLFWIPAHTITFLLPEGFRVLFAALLGIVLGVILAFAARSGK
ncbi:MAG: Mpv17/PMP22 family protein [Bacteroidetes bacterium]|nr:Mpv17/PMP22 family protein [Bacteroidota bacterium]